MVRRFCGNVKIEVIFRPCLFLISTIKFYYFSYQAYRSRENKMSAKGSPENSVFILEQRQLSQLKASFLPNTKVQQNFCTHFCSFCFLLLLRFPILALPANTFMYVCVCMLFLFILAFLTESIRLKLSHLSVNCGFCVLFGCCQWR